MHSFLYPFLKSSTLKFVKCALPRQRHLTPTPVAKGFSGAGQHPSEHAATMFTVCCTTSPNSISRTVFPADVSGAGSQTRVGWVFCISHPGASVPTEPHACRGVLPRAQCWIMSPLCALWGPLLLKCTGNSRWPPYWKSERCSSSPSWATPWSWNTCCGVKCAAPCHVACVISLTRGANDFGCRPEAYAEQGWRNTVE